MASPTNHPTLTKKCPFCAEQINADAIKCKFCGSMLNAQQKPAIQNGESKKKPTSTFGKIVIGIVVLGFGIAVFNSILDDKASELSKSVTEKDAQKVADLKDYAAQHEMVDNRFVYDKLLHAQTIAANLVEPEPAIDLLASGTTFSSQDATDDYKSIKRVANINSGQEVSFYQAVDGTGSWKGENYSMIKFKDADGQENIGWIKSDYLLSKSDYDSVSAEFNKTPEGKLCNAHKDWAYSDCLRIAADSVWIGMSLEMLKAERGLPSSANPSNYGGGTKWQWCWNDLKPMCFYDNDGDYLIDAYN